MTIITCPITNKTYERFNSNNYHEDDCPYCKKSKKKINFLLIGICLSLFLINCVSAIEWSGISIENNYSNVTINITGTIYFDSLSVGIDNPSIYFENLRSSDSSTETLTFNITNEANITIDGQPIWFSSSSDTEKHIASNLTNSVISLVLFNVNSCDNLGNIYYTPNGDSKLTYQRGDYTCNNNIVTITLQINPSAESNVLELEYGCNTFTRIGFRLIMLFSSLAILGFTFFFIKFRYDTNGFQVGDVIILFIGILVSIIIYTIFGQTLGGSCGVLNT